MLKVLKLKASGSLKSVNPNGNWKFKKLEVLNLIGWKVLNC